MARVVFKNIIRLSLKCFPVDAFRRNINLPDLINKDLRVNGPIETRVLNVSSVEKDEVYNMVRFSKQMLISTESLQINDYVITNHKVT